MHISGRHISLSPRNRLFVRIIAADTARVSPCLFCSHAWSCKASLDEAVWGQSCSTDTAQSRAADGHVCLTSHRYSDETQRMSVAASSTVVASQHQFFLCLHRMLLCVCILILHVTLVRCILLWLCAFDPAQMFVYDLPQSYLYHPVSFSNAACCRREKAARGRLSVMCWAQMIRTLSNLKVDFKKKKTGNR